MQPMPLWVIMDPLQTKLAQIHGKYCMAGRAELAANMGNLEVGKSDAWRDYKQPRCMASTMATSSPCTWAADAVWAAC